MTRQAAPPAHRWLILIVVLLLAPWVGRGTAFAYSISVNPQSGPAGTTVSVLLEDFGAGCIVYFDGAPVAGAKGCEGPTNLVFDVPPTATVGNHEILAEGIVVDGTPPSQTMPFRVTAQPPTTPPTTATPSPPVSTSANNVAVGPVGAPAAGSPTTRASTPPATIPPTTAEPGTTTTVLAESTNVVTTTGSGPYFAAACPPRQVALLRFSATPTAARPGGKVTGTTTWGSVGTCTEIRALRVILDGKTVPGSPPVAGTPGTFEMTIPRDARPGAHQLTLVADDDPSFELAAIGFEVEKGKASLLPVAGLVAAGVVLLLALLLLVRRRRRRRRRGADDWDGGGAPWAGEIDAPDLAPPAPLPETVAMAAPAAAAPAAAAAPVVVEDDPTMPVVPLVVTSGRDGSFYLLERQNPHAPRRPNGKRGWYRDRQTQPIRGIVAATVEPHTAGAAASELAMGETAASAHVVVDVDGVLDLLPDDMVAIHAPRVDDATLVMLLAGVGNDPATDGIVLGHAAAWADAKMREYGIPARLVTPAELEAGQGGLLSTDPTALWPRMVVLAPADDSSPAEVAAEAVVDAVLPGPGPGPTPTPGPGPTPTPTPTPPLPEEEVAVPDAPAVPAPAAFVETFAAEPITAGVAAEPGPAPPAEPEPEPRTDRPRRALPSPDELIAQVSGAGSYYLVDHENPHGTLRANGKHGWYYPTRYGGIRAVVLHTLPGGDTADEVAAHLARVDLPEAAHAVVDPDAIVELLPDEATALHGVRSSSAAIDLGLVYDPSRWGADPAREEALLVRAATWTGVRAVRHGIPVRRITVDQWHTGQAGIAASGDLDPGPDFPWDRFLQLTAWVAGRVAAGAMSSR